MAAYSRKLVVVLGGHTKNHRAGSSVSFHLYLRLREIWIIIKKGIEVTFSHILPEVVRRDFLPPRPSPHLVSQPTLGKAVSFFAFIALSRYLILWYVNPHIVCPRPTHPKKASKSALRISGSFPYL